MYHKNLGKNPEILSLVISGNPDVVCAFVATVVALKANSKYPYFYRPQRSCEGYVFTRVCHSVHGGVPGPGGVPGSRGVCSRGGVVSQHALRQTPPGQTATAADGTHPTGMHSCCTGVFIAQALKHCQGEDWNDIFLSGHYLWMQNRIRFIKSSISCMLPLSVLMKNYVHCI